MRVWVSASMYHALHVHREVHRGVVSMETAGHTRYRIVAGQRKGGSMTT